MCKFRTLNADEVEVRVAKSGKSKGRVWAQYLIYKDARVDQKLLDETVGPEFWQKSYEFLDGKLYCTVSIYNKELKEWIGKQDVGVESNTEKEKGQASDAFKRACFNWGIGRELYTAPKDLYIDLREGEYDEKEGKIYPKNNLFTVAEMNVEEGKITKLVIIDNNLDVRFSYPKKTLKTTNVERKHPSISQLESMAKRIAKGENLTDKIQVHFLMSQDERKKLEDLIKFYTV